MRSSASTFRAVPCPQFCRACISRSPGSLGRTDAPTDAATSDLLTRGGWGLPPVVLAIALGFGLGELKRQAAKYRETTRAVPVGVPAGGVVKPGLPSVREVREDHRCGPMTEQKIRRALRARDAQWAQAVERGQGATTSPRPVLVTAPAGATPSPAPAPAGAPSPNGNGAHG